MDKLQKYINKLADLLSNSGRTLSVAESCTGGMLSQSITMLSGCSSWYEGGVVSYSNKIKQQLLSVQASSLFEYGAVSDMVAKEMVIGVTKAFNTSLGISTTGIAGPTGGTIQKPIGTVYIAWFVEGVVYSKAFLFLGSRQKIRQSTVKEALLTLIALLSKDK